jgi:CheY-like chemotaxis protein
MLAGGIAHDFNNLLVAILGNTELMLELMSSDDNDRELVEEIRAAGDSARELVAQLLAFSRKQVLHLRDVDLAEEARKVLRLVNRALPENVSVEVDIDGALPVRADPSQLQQVILNLVVNATDAMPHGGKVSVIGRRAGTAEAPTVVLAIVDTGTGMNEATLSKVFEPFFTTKELGRGTGLGLSTAYGIVEQHGGTLVATSVLGHGSRFEITLPRTLTTTATASSGRIRRPTAREREAVLVVEDEPMVLAVVKRLLVAEGYRVLGAGGPEEALLIAARHPEIELVVTDVIMPVMNGKTMVDRSCRCAEHGALYMSGYDNEVLAPQGVATTTSAHAQTVLERYWWRGQTSLERAASLCLGRLGRRPSDRVDPEGMPALELLVVRVVLEERAIALHERPEWRQVERVLEGVEPAIARQAPARHVFACVDRGAVGAIDSAMASAERAERIADADGPRRREPPILNRDVELATVRYIRRPHDQHRLAALLDRDQVGRPLVRSGLRDVVAGHHALDEREIDLLARRERAEMGLGRRPLLDRNDGVVSVQRSVDREKREAAVQRRGGRRRDRRRSGAYGRSDRSRWRDHLDDRQGRAGAERLAVEEQRDRGDTGHAGEARHREQV